MTQLDTTRREKVERDGSPVFTFLNPIIAAGGQWILNFESATPLNGDAKDAAKYLPLDSMVVTNTNNTSSVRLHPNQSKSFSILVYKGSSRSIKRNCESVIVVNLDAVNAIAAEEIVVEAFISRMDADKKARLS